MWASDSAHPRRIGVPRRSPFDRGVSSGPINAPLSAAESHNACPRAPCTQAPACALGESDEADAIGGNPGDRHFLHKRIDHIQRPSERWLVVLQRNKKPLWVP